MRFHVVSLPHTQTVKAFSSCAYTQKVRKFCNMMKARGHTVFLYAGEQNDAACDALIPCITEAERAAVVGDQFYVNAAFDPALPHWQKFNAKAIDGIRIMSQPRDFICVIGGRAHKPIADALPQMRTVEFGIGYSGTFAAFRVFESYAWMHAVYGHQSKEPMNEPGRFFDTVIPNYFEIEDFPFSAEKDDYFLFLGRLDAMKGARIASMACEAEGKALVLAGPGTPPAYGKHVGVVGPEERGKLLSRAKALIAPTEYLEPFGGVAVEAMLCGTPVITTDWGGFTETVQHGVTGFRCHQLSEFRQALTAVKLLSPAKIRDYAVGRYSTEVVAAQYEQYFQRLAMLWDTNWDGTSIAA